MAPCACLGASHGTACGPAAGRPLCRPPEARTRLAFALTPADCRKNVALNLCEYRRVRKVLKQRVTVCDRKGAGCHL